MYNYNPTIDALRRQSIEKAKKLKKEKEDTFLINTTELNTVKTLFQIRNANYYKKRIRNDYQISIFPKERVFIAGKIFPVINLIFKETASAYNASKIELKNWKSSDPVYNSKIHNRQYISIDNDNLMILLPISYSGVNFPELMLDFLTNGSKTKHTIGGEFPDYPTYKLALREKAINIKDWEGQDGCWLTNDRGNNKRWENAQDFILKNKLKGRLAPFNQIADFYHYVGKKCQKKEFQHDIKWYKGAATLVDALDLLEGGNLLIANDVETILNELNLGICDYAITQFYDLFYGKYAKIPLKGNAAYDFDKNFIIYEQGTVAPPIYKKADKLTIQRFQDMADKDPQSGWHGLGGVFNSVTPAFDDFTPPAKVTDNLFRIDLPLLMLYLDKHTIDKNNCSPSLKNYLTLDGHVNDECKKIIRKYEIK